MATVGSISGLISRCFQSQAVEQAILDITGALRRVKPSYDIKGVGSVSIEFKWVWLVSISIFGVLTRLFNSPVGILGFPAFQGPENARWI